MMREEILPAGSILREGAVQDVSDEVEVGRVQFLAEVNEGCLRVDSVLRLFVLKHEVRDLAPDLSRRFRLAVVLLEVDADHVLLVHRYPPSKDLAEVFIKRLIVRVCNVLIFIQSNPTLLDFSACYLEVGCWLEPLNDRFHKVVLLQSLLGFLSLRNVYIRLTLLARAASLRLDDNLRHVLVLEALLVNDLLFPVDDSLPILLVLVNQVLNLEPDSGAQLIAMSVREDSGK